VIIIGVGFELYRWAAEKGLDVYLLVLSLIVLIILIVMAMRIEFKPCPISLCRNCMYEKEKQGGHTLSCTSYKPKLLLRERRPQCPFEKLIGEEK
jgi:hypothetical protein